MIMKKRIIIIKISKIQTINVQKIQKTQQPNQTRPVPAKTEGTSRPK